MYNAHIMYNAISVCCIIIYTLYYFCIYNDYEYLGSTDTCVNATSDLAVYYASNAIKSVIDHTLIDRINFR